MGYATWLPNVLRSAGLKVELVPGWETRGRSTFSPKGVLWHHTATGPNWSDDKVMRLLRDGRPGLSGPLSQLGLKRDGTYVVIAAGRANHAGRGSWGPMSGNTSAIGIEAYNSGLGEAWSPEQYEAYVRGTAAMLAHLGQPFSSMAGHKEFATPRGRKPDPAGIDMEKARLDVRRVLSGGTLPPPIVQRGHRGGTVVKVQKIVGAAPADGAFGPGTEAAVAAWQKENGLPVTGVFDADDWKRAENPTAPSPAVEPAASTADLSKAAVTKDAEGEALTPDEIKFIKEMYAESVKWEARPSSLFHILRWFRWARKSGAIDGRSYMKD